MVEKRIPSTAGKHMEPDLERRQAFAVAYFETGNAVKSAVMAGVHNNTAAAWKSQPWFAKAIKDLKRARDNELDGRLSGIIEKALDRLEERIEKGDEKLFMTKDGVVVRERQKVDAKALAVVTGVLFDKRAQIRKEPDSDDTATSALDRIAEKLREYAATGKVDALRDVRTVDVEAVEVTGNEDLV